MGSTAVFGLSFSKPLKTTSWVSPSEIRPSFIWEMVNSR